MKKFNKFLIPALALGLFAACSDDKMDNPATPEGTESSVTMSISVQLPTATSSRAANNVGNPATEAGSADECKVNRMIIVLADPTNNGFIDYADVTIDNSNNAETTNIVKCNATFSISTITNYINSLSGTSTANVNAFAFCNYSEDFAAYLSSLTKNSKDTDWVNKYATVNNTAVDVTGKWNTSVKADIPMANSEIFTKDLPPVSELSKHDETNPIQLSTSTKPIKVERSIARFDFKDGSKGNFTYTIYDQENSKINVVLDRIGLVNMSNKYYYLRHTAPNAENTTTSADLTKATILDASISMPWIVDVDAETKSSYTDGVSTTDFLFPVVGTNNQPGRNLWYSTAVSAFASADEDNKDWAGEAGYKVWRYVTENTIPVASLQKNGQSTGIVFKAKLAFEGEGALATALNKAKTNKEAIYFYKSDKVVPLGSAEDVKKANPIYADAFKESVKNDDPTSKESKEALTAAGFIIYEPAEGGDSALGTNDTAGEYYMYYYYWNRHDDNGEVNVMAPMEFGVVRNHIYKLKVTDISNLGHPRKPENDPDPEDPKKDDEEGNVAIELYVQAVDWSVRENGIKF